MSQSTTVDLKNLMIPVEGSKLAKVTLTSIASDTWDIGKKETPLKVTFSSSSETPPPISTTIVPTLWGDHLSQDTCEQLQKATTNEAAELGSNLREWSTGQVTRDTWAEDSYRSWGTEMLHKKQGEEDSNNPAESDILAYTDCPKKDGDDYELAVVFTADRV